MDALMKELAKDSSVDEMLSESEKEQPRHLFDIDHTILNSIKVCFVNEGYR